VLRTAKSAPMYAMQVKQMLAELRFAEQKKEKIINENLIYYYNIKK